MAANIIFPDGTTLNISDISANINTYSTQPSTSEGKGEIAYFEDTDSVMVNKGTASSPDWQSMGGTGSGIVVCTSTTKPSSPSEGDLIYVTDNTDGQELEHYDGTAWQTVNDNSGLVQNPMTADLDTGGYKIKNPSGSVTFESSTGVFTFQKSS
jgi:hypothetical protein